MGYTAVILAGGKSQRFGMDKRKLEINGVNIVEAIVDQCRPLFSEILVVGGNFDISDTRSVSDIYPDAGPLAGIHAGLTAAENQICFVLACDMPNFSPRLTTMLLKEANRADIVLPKTGPYVQPLYAVYKKSVLGTAERLLSQGIRSVLRLHELSNVVHIEVGVDEETPENSVFFNINYKEDYNLFKEAIPPVLSVVGFSDSGKTTYLEKLIPALKKRNIKIAVIKHDAHSFDIDIPGKDSWRLKQAGADITMISSPLQIATMEKVEKEEDLLQLASRLKGKVDLVLTEGYKRDKALKIEIRRAAKSREPFCKDEELIAIASDYSAEKETVIPQMPLDDAEPMADLILRFIERGGVK